MLLLKGHGGAVHTLAFSPDGHTLASGGGNSRVIWLWDLRRRRTRTTLRGHLSRITSLAFSPDGNLLASGSYFIDSSGNGGYFSPLGERLKLWDLSALPESLTLRMPSGNVGYPVEAVENLTFSPDSRSLYVPVGTALFRWDVGGWRDARAGGRLMDFRAEDLAPSRQDLPGSAVVQSPDGGKVLVWDSYGTVRVARADTGEACLRVGPFQPLRRARFSPDGTTVALLSGRQVTLCDAAGARPPASFQGHTLRVNDLAFSPDGRLLATAGNDGTVRLWDVDSGRERTVFDWKVGKVGSVAFSPDGLMLVAGGDKDIIVWDVDET